MAPHINTEFNLRGFNHVALVCRDMAETVAFYEDVLGMKLVKTIQHPDGRGQHFFLDMGNGHDGVAFFWWPDAVEGAPGEAVYGGYDDNMQIVGDYKTAIGTMNHLAFDVAPEALDEYREKLIKKGIALSETWNHANSLEGGHKPGYDANSDDGDVFIRSLYFKDPNGVILEFAAWTTVLQESDVAHAPARARAAPEAVAANS